MKTSKVNGKRTITNEHWKKYQETGDISLRNKIAEGYFRTVKYYANKIKSNLPDNIELDDLCSPGYLGLLDAIDSYDISRGVKFETYCEPRIKGAILDDIRKKDDIPRSLRSRQRKFDNRTRRLETKFCIKVGHNEALVSLIDSGSFNNLGNRSYAFQDALRGPADYLSINYEYGDDSKTPHFEDYLKDDGITSYEHSTRKSMRDFITRGLERDERLILILYYYEELSQREIGEVIGISESRVSQLRMDILTRLKTKLTEWAKKSNGNGKDHLQSEDSVFYAVRDELF